MLGILITGLTTVQCSPQMAYTAHIIQMPDVARRDILEDSWIFKVSGSSLLPPDMTFSDLFLALHGF